MNKKMVTGIIYIAIGIILMAIFGAIGNYHIQKSRTESANSNKEEILSKQDSVNDVVLKNQNNNKKEIIDSVISNKEKVIENTNVIKEGQKNLENQIKTAAKNKKPEIKVENSPNSVIQINEQGDNIIDNRQTVVNNNVEIPEPTLKISRNKENIKNNNSQYVNEFLVEIQTVFPIPRVFFMANGNFINDIEVNGETGVQFNVMKSVNKESAQYSFSNLNQGNYKVIVISTEIDDINISVGKK